MTAILVGSSDFDRVKAHYDELKEGHAERMQSISMMTFSVENHRIHHYAKAYIKVFGKRMYLKGDEITRAKDAGYAIHFE